MIKSEKLQFGFLKEEDLRAVYDLCQETFHESPTFSEVEATFRECRNDSSNLFLVGKIDDAIAAYASLHLFYNLFDGKRPILTLWYVCVNQAFRRQGIGTALFRKIERIAKERNCEMITLTCLSDNGNAQAFYRAMGYSDEKETAFVKYLF